MKYSLEDFRSWEPLTEGKLQKFGRLGENENFQALREFLEDHLLYLSYNLLASNPKVQDGDLEELKKYKGEYRLLTKILDLVDNGDEYAKKIGASEEGGEE